MEGKAHGARFLKADSAAREEIPPGQASFSIYYMGRVHGLGRLAEARLAIAHQEKPTLRSVPRSGGQAKQAAGKLEIDEALSV